MEIDEFKSMSLEEFREFIDKQIPFCALEKGVGIHETNPIIKDANGDDISIGVTYDVVDSNVKTNFKEGYYYNIFVGGEYIPVKEDCVAYANNRVPISIVRQIKNLICELLERSECMCRHTEIKTSKLKM